MYFGSRPHIGNDKDPRYISFSHTFQFTSPYGNDCRKAEILQSAEHFNSHSHMGNDLVKKLMEIQKKYFNSRPCMGNDIGWRRSPRNT